MAKAKKKKRAKKKMWSVQFMRDTTECADARIEANSEVEAEEKAEALLLSNALEWYGGQGNEDDARVVHVERARD